VGASIAVGIIRKPHGIRGEASVELWTNSADRFRKLKAVTLVSPDESETRDLRIESSRAHADRVLIKFEGIESPDDLRGLQNWTIEIPASKARKLEKNEYFLHDLVGLTLFDRDGNERGVVNEVYEGGSGILLNVTGPKGEFDVPFAEEICTEINLKKKRIVVELPEGLDDLTNVED